MENKKKRVFTKEETEEFNSLIKGIVDQTFANLTKPLMKAMKASLKVALAEFVLDNQLLQASAINRVKH